MFPPELSLVLSCSTGSHRPPVCEDAWLLCLQSPSDKFSWDWEGNRERGQRVIQETPDDTAGRSPEFTEAHLHIFTEKETKSQRREATCPVLQGPQQVGGSLSSQQREPDHTRLT